MDEREKERNARLKVVRGEMLRVLRKFEQMPNIPHTHALIRAELRAVLDQELGQQFSEGFEIVVRASSDDPTALVVDFVEREGDERMEIAGTLQALPVLDLLPDFKVEADSGVHIGIFGEVTRRWPQARMPISHGMEIMIIPSEWGAMGDQSWAKAIANASDVFLRRIVAALQNEERHRLESAGEYGGTDLGLLNAAKALLRAAKRAESALSNNGPERLLDSDEEAAREALRDAIRFAERQGVQEMKGGEPVESNDTMAFGLVVLVDGQRWSWKIRMRLSPELAKAAMNTRYGPALRSTYLPPICYTGRVECELAIGSPSEVAAHLSGFEKHPDAPEQFDPWQDDDKTTSGMFATRRLAARKSGPCWCWQSDEVPA